MKTKNMLLIAACACVLASTGCSNQQADLKKNVQAFVQAGDFERADELVNSYITENPQDPFGRESLVLLEIAKDDWEQAFEEYLKYVKMTEKHSPELIGTGLDLVLSDSPQYIPESIEDFNRKHDEVVFDFNVVVTNLLDDALGDLDLEKSARMGLLAGLGKTGTAKAQDILIANMKSGTDSWFCAEILGDLGRPEGGVIRLEAVINQQENLAKNYPDRKSTYLDRVKNAQAAWSAGDSSAASTGLVSVLDDMAKNKWETELIDGVIHALIDLGHPTAAFDSMLRVFKNFPSSWDTYTNVLSNSLKFLVKTPKTDEQKDLLTEELDSFVHKYTIGNSRGMGDDGAVGQAYGILKEYDPPRAKTLYNEIPPQMRRRRNISE